jgi:predicted Zn-dependent protease
MQMSSSFHELVTRVRHHPLRAVAGLAAVVLLGWGAYSLAGYVLAEYHSRAARKALDRLDLDEAQRHLDLAVRARPRNAAIRLLAARTARRRGMPELAEQHLAVYEKLQGVNSESALEQALLAAQEGELSEVEGPLAELLKKNGPETPLILEALAQGYLSTTHLEEAMKCVQALLQRQPDHPYALVLRGRIQEVSNRDDQAVKDFERALELQPALDKARLRLAETLSRLGRVREAVGQYDCLRRRLPGNAEVTLGLARCDHDLHELAEAQRLLDELLAAQPDLVPALVERGRLALRMGQPAQAEEGLRRAVALAPYDRDAYLILHFCLEAQGKDSEAAACLARMKAIETETTHAAALMRKVADVPHDPALRYEIGAILLRRGDAGQGLRWLYSALQEDPRHGPTHAALADYYQRTGQPDRAAKHRH